MSSMRPCAGDTFRGRRDRGLLERVTPPGWSATYPPGAYLGAYGCFASSPIGFIVPCCRSTDAEAPVVGIRLEECEVVGNPDQRPAVTGQGDDRAVSEDGVETV